MSDTIIKNSNITSLIQRFNLGFVAYIFLITGLYFWALYFNSYPHMVFIPLMMAFVPIVIDGIKDLFERKITTEFFLIFATGIAIIAGQKEAITAVLLIMMLAKYVEKFIEEKTGRAIESLIRLIPTMATIYTEHDEETISLDVVKPGMQVIIKTGGQIPVDGIVVKGQASVNESFLTGESLLKEKQQGDLVFAGTFVDAGSVIIKVQKVAGDTYFGKISNLLAQAEHEKANIIAVANKAAMVIVVVLIAFIVLVWLRTGDLTLVATLLVFGSPIELTLITPLAVLAGTAAAFRCGILVKGSIALERFAAVDTLIFDKTGTLTMGEPTVVLIESADEHYSQNDILKLAAIIEKRSGHVLAKSILKKAYEHKIIIPDPESYESITGHGVEAVYQGKHCQLGSQHFIEAPEHGNIPIPAFFLSGSDESVTYFYLASSGKLCGRIGVSDIIRPEAKSTIDQLRESGIKNIILLSGDRFEVAQHIAVQLGIEKVYGEVAPDQKLSIIKDLQAKGCRIAMVGDGINDAPALKQADVGIAMGAMGMEPAIEAADIVLTSNDLYGIVFVHQLSKKIMRLIMQNIFLGFLLIHLLGIVLALLSLVTPIQAALFHAVSDLLILLNSAWLIRFSLKKR